jgi:glutathione S-transferase
MGYNMDFHIPSLITSFTLLLLFGVALNVGRARAKYKIDAPATTGHPKFELAYRVQMNTVENTVAFIPALWLFSYYVSTTWSGILGGLWLVGRLWYAVAYSEDAKKRGGGFGLSFFAFLILMVGALTEIVLQMI